MINLDALLNLNPIIHLPDDYKPPIEDQPVTIRTIEHSPPMDMHLPMADPCPECGAFNMFVGDYVCYESCSACYLVKMKEEEQNEHS